MAVVDVPLNIAYSVFEVLIDRSYSRAHISTWSHRSCRLCLDSASSTRSSAYSRQFILCSPSSLSPVPCLLSLCVNCSGMRLNSSGEVTAPYLTPLFTCHSWSGWPLRMSLLISLSYISCSIATASFGYSCCRKRSKSWFLLMLSKALRRSMNHACTLPLLSFYI